MTLDAFRANMKSVSKEADAAADADPYWELGIALERIARLRQREPGLSDVTLRALSGLCDSGARRLTDMARAEGITQPAMSQLVDRLERDGLARRTQGRGDRRVTRVEITPEGRDLVARHRLRTARLLAQAGAPRVGAVGIEGAVRVLDEIAGAVEDRAPTAPAGRAVG